MKLVKSLLLGSAAGLATVAAAQAADLPTRKAAPVEYVRVCDAYGAGFFYIPGTDTCLRVGGLLLAQVQIQPSTQLYSVALTPGAAVGNFANLGLAGVAGQLPAPSTYRSVFGREILGYNATARFELDSRTQSPFGTVRTFARLSAGYGSSANATTGSLATALGFNNFNVTGGPTVSREILFIDKAFIQFAGITAGRVQSFFDFYADAINYTGLKGSNSSPFAAAYTYTFGGGFSATLAAEDAASHRGPVASVISTASINGPPLGTTAAGGGVTALVGAARLPNIVANVRWDAPWGAAQLSGALNQVRANLLPTGAAGAGLGLVAFGGAPNQFAEPVASSSSLGFAVQAGVQFNLDMLAPGDKLWLQATYAHGAIGYIQGAALAFTNGVSATANYGVGINRSNNGVGWTGFTDVDCVFTYTGGCDKSNAFALVAAFKHYWTPTISSGLFGSFSQVTYSTAAQFPINPLNNAVIGAGVAQTGAPNPTLFTQGITNFRDLRVGTNIVWTPVKNFDIGAEFAYIRYMTQRPFGLAPDAVLQLNGLPKFTGTTDQFETRLRMIRAF